MFYMLDARLALVSAAQALQAKERVDEMQRKGVTESEKIELLELERIRNAAIHPQTGIPIMAPLRLSMVVPVNCFLDALMLSAKTPLQTITAQWLNQSYNAAHYYANRNTSNSEDMLQLGTAYAAATASSVSMALFLKSGRFAKTRLGMYAPFCAVAAADLLNLGIMRKSEFLTGVNVYDVETEELVGTSCRAGLMATGSCIFARITVAFPILAGTPMIIDHLDKRLGTFQKFPRARLPATLACVAFMIQFSVPLVFGIFRQDMVVPSSWLEPEIAARHPGKVYFNKGL